MKALKVADVARILNCSERKVRELVRKGEGPVAVRLGLRTVRFAAEEVQAYIRGERTDHPEE